MTALAYTTAIQNRIANLLGLSYSTTTAFNKALIDGTWSSGALGGGVALDALTEIQQIGQWFGLVAPTSVPSEWEAWLVAKTVLMAGKVIHPERTDGYQKLHDDAEMAAIDAYGRNLVTYDPGATPEATTLTIQNVRYYVMSHCARRERWHTVDGQATRRPRLWVSPEVVDAQIERVLRNLWNRAYWNFRRRVVTMKINPITVTNATWTASTKTLTSTGNFGTSATIPVGSTVIITGGTSVTTGYYIVASSTADTLVLTGSCYATDLSAADIELTVVAVTFPTLDTSETFHQVASRRFYYDDSTAGGLSFIEWAKDGTEMSRVRANQQSNGVTRRPAIYRFENNSDVLSWDFYPIPDQVYTAKGEIFVKGPTLASTAASTVGGGRFPEAFNHVIKDAVLAETLRHYGDPQGKEMWLDIEQEIQRLLPQFCDVGQQEEDQEVRDVYGDYYNNLPRYRMFLGVSNTFGGTL